MKINLFVRGILYTSLASLFWGLAQPIYFYNIKFVPALEIVSHRAIWSFVFLSLLILISRKFKEFKLIFLKKKNILYLSVTGSLIAINWTLFILSISLNRIQDASMGYFISPIISIGLGYIFLKEKLTSLKKFSLLLMIISILIILLGMKIFPILAVSIGLSWATYGLIKKKISISAEVGLMYESFFISIFAILFLIFISAEENYFFQGFTISLLLFFTGFITIFPLFFFNLGVKVLPLGFTGIIFYLTPSLQFASSVFIFDELISYYKLVSFIIIWIAVIIFLVDQFKEEYNQK